MRSRGRISVGSIGITSPSETLSPKSPLSPDTKCKSINVSGNFSPVHTRLRAQSEDVPKVLPDFAEFPISQKCPRLTTKMEMEVHDPEAELLDLLQIESELNMFLTHCIDHQKKLSGEIHFMETGDYRSEDISKRLMPSYKLRSSEDVSASTSAEAVQEPSPEAVEINEEEEYENSCPTANMPGKFWKFVGEYQGPINEAFLHRYYTQFLSPSFSSDMLRLCEEHPVQNGKIVSASPRRNAVTATSCTTSPTIRKPLKRQSSTGKRLGRPPKSAKVVAEDVDSLLAETIQALNTEERLNSEGFQNGVSNAHDCNGVERVSNVCNGIVKESEEKFDRKSSSLDDKFADKFDKTYLGVEYRNLREAVMNAMDASQNEEKKTLKKESSLKDTKVVNGTNGSHIIAQFEAFKRRLMEFVNAVGDVYSVETEPANGCNEISLSAQNLNGHFENGCKVEDIDAVEDGREDTVEISQRLDPVSAALKKAQDDLRDRNEICRSLLVTIWNRLLAEFLRSKAEKDLLEATKELNSVKEKYFRDYPPKRPSNDQEREECECALRKYKKVLRSYYGE